MNEHPRLPAVKAPQWLGVQPPRASGRWRLAALGLLLFLTLAAGAGYYYFGSRTTSYVTAQAIRGDLTVTVSATGTIEPQDKVDVGAEISGRIDKINVDFNDKVKQGQVLALINTDLIRAQLGQARAALAAARANVSTMDATVTETKLKSDRANALFAGGSIAAQEKERLTADYERAVAGSAKARADVESSAAQVTLHDTNLRRATIRAPIDGVVLDRRVSLGQTVAAAFQTPVLFTLASDLSRMELQVDIDEADIGSVQEGQKATFTVDAFPQRRFDATLVSLRNSPQTENGVVTYKGILEVDNSSMLLRPGLTATVDIVVSDAKDALLVPNGALRFSPPGNASAPSTPARSNGEVQGRIFVLRNGNAERRDLKLGRSDGTHTEVLSGDLQPGDSVITDVDAANASRR
jgi:HlyD family secretion protein